MEVHITPDQETRLTQIARRDGKTDAGELLKEAALRMLDDDARFRAAGMEGKAYAGGGEFIDEEEMDARFEQMLGS